MEEAEKEVGQMAEVEKEEVETVEEKTVAAGLEVEKVEWEKAEETAVEAVMVVVCLAEGKMVVTLED